MPTLYRIYNEAGDLLCYAAELSPDGSYWRAGPASGPVVGAVEVLTVGDTFSHWEFGSVTVRKINRKSLVLINESGREVRLPL